MLEVIQPQNGGPIRRAAAISNALGGENRCTATTRGGLRCRNHVVPGMEYCEAHLRAFSNIEARDQERGRYSDTVTGPLASAYELALQDRYLLNLRDEIAVVDARIKDLMTQVKGGVNAAAWKVVQRQWEMYKSADRKGDAERLAYLYDELDKSIIVGRKESDLWLDIERLFEQRRKLVETEQKHLKTTGQTITAEAAMVLLAAAISALKESVKRYVQSRDIADAIIVDAQHEYAKIVGTTDG